MCLHYCTKSRPFQYITIDRTISIGHSGSDSFFISFFFFWPGVGLLLSATKHGNQPSTWWLLATFTVPKIIDGQRIQSLLPGEVFQTPY